MINQKRQRHTIESLRKLALDKKWDLLSDVYKGGPIKHDFICDKGHKIKKTIEHFLRGSGCQVCSGKAALSIDDFRIQAEKNNWKLLTEKYSGKTEILEFKCLKCNNEFPLMSSYLRGKKITKNCPFCSPLKKKTVEEIKSLSAKLGILCISDVSNGMMTKLKWRCKNNHDWQATPNDVINNKSGCPSCSFHKTEAKIKYIFETYFNVEFVKEKNITGRKFELDGYNSALKLAFEYNGIQHYQYVHYFHKTKKSFEELKIRDKAKIEFCKVNKIDLIIIPYTVQDNKVLAEYIIDKLPTRFKINNEKLLKIIEGFGLNSDMLKPIREKLNKKNLELISNVYTTADTKNLEVKCLRCGYIYFTNKLRVFKGNGCKKCSGIMAFTIDELKAIAKVKEGKLIAEKYIPGEKVEWQCNLGHKWFATPSVVKGSSNRRGTWCPVCNGKKTGTIEAAQELAKSRGHICLSKSFVNRDSILKWKCDKGHIWESSFQSYKNSKNGCRFCSGKEK